MSIDANKFTKETKAGLKIDSDISSDGLVWRKQSNGSGMWRYDFVLNGHRHRGTIGPESSGINFTTAKRVCEERRKQAFLNKFEVKNGPDYGNTPFNEFAELFLLYSKNIHRSYWDNESRARQHLIPFFSFRTLSDISVRDIEGLMDALRTKGLRNSTINRVLYLLSAMFEYAIRYDETIRNPVRKAKKLGEGIHQIEIFTDDEVSKLFAAAGENTTYKVMLGLARFAGLRAAEALGLEWKNVDLERKVLYVRQTAMEGKIISNTKSGDPREIYISEKLHQLLLAHRKISNAGGLVLCSKSGKPYHHVQKIFSQLRKKAGIRSGIGYHGLRHTFATKAAEDGNVWALQKALGHSNIKTTERYVHIEGKHLKDMIERMDARA